MRGAVEPWASPPAVGDVLLVLAALAAAVLLAVTGGSAPPPREVVIEVDGQLRHRLELEGERRLTVNGPIGPTTVEVQDRRARIVHAPCRAQICVRRGWIDGTGEMAVCVPNRVVVRITGGSQSDLDGITQ